MHEIMERAKREAKALACKEPISCEDLKYLGEWIDIIKDAKQCMCYDVETMKSCIEVEYMKEIKIPNKLREGELTERMLDDFDQPEYGPMGYDRYRYKNGRFAPKGRGTRMGYSPYYRMHPENDYDDNWMDDDGNRLPNMRDKNGMMGNRSSRKSKYGQAYDRYENYRRNYTETKSPEHQQHMKESMNEYVEDVMESFKDMWKEADPTDRQTIKQAMTKLVQQMQ